MPRVGQVKQSEGERLSDRVALGVLTRLVPRHLVDEVLTETGRREQRVRLLPARMVVYYVMALALFFGDGYEEVMRRLVGSLRQMGAWRSDWVVPSTAALTKARARLGPEPLRLLFERVATPMAPPSMAGAFYAGRRVMAVDGTNIDLCDTAENVAEFGYSSGDGAFPQVRVVALAEARTHAVIAISTGRARVGERELFVKLLDHLSPGMLLLADRGFLSYDLWGRCLATEADLCWRAKSAAEMPVLEILPDGSYLSQLLDPAMVEKNRWQKRNRTPRPLEIPSHTVRVIEYKVTARTGEATEPDTYRLITTLLDPDEAPAPELCALYHRRWELESTFDEIKTTQRGAGIVLRSKSPPMVYQELYALLLTHYAVRELMLGAAPEDENSELERLSFLRSLRLVRRHVTNQAAFSP